MYAFNRFLLNKFLLKAHKKVSHTDTATILIYCDEGVSQCSMLGFIVSIRAILKDHCLIKVIGAQEIINTSWEQTTQLLVMPGGRARPFYTSLGASWKKGLCPKNKMRRLDDIGQGNQKIKNFINNGGGFLGVCAGAYYASAKTVFESGTALEIIDEGALTFFQGIAQGPAYGVGKFCYNSRAGAKLAKIVYHSDATIMSDIYYNGGCFFIPTPAKNSCIQGLAVYDDLPEKPYAIIQSRVGNGLAVLSGVHFEISPCMMPIYWLLNLKFARTLNASKNNNIKILKNILHRLLNY